MTASVVLLHGLWMRGFAMGVLGRRLRAAGFAVASFDYASVADGPGPAIARLVERLGATATPPTALVGHSLGGLVALEALRQARSHRVARVVCLGSPLRGSCTARRLGLWPGGRRLIGRSFDLLCGGVAAWDGKPEVGVIAGRLPYGLGMFTQGLASPHDGTVAVAETRLPGIRDHVVLPATHTGLAFSDEAARQVIAFLEHGKFRAEC